MTLSFADVVNAWEQAGEEEIHPLWSVDQDNFWESGWYQAHQAVEDAPEGARVLDFGAGNGRLAIPLARLGYDVIAVDASATMLERLKKRAKQEKTTVATAKSDGTDLLKAIGRKKVDVAIARAVLIHHDYEGVEKLVRALASVTKVGGQVVADWPVGEPQIRPAFNRVTVWAADHRAKVAEAAGLKIVKEYPDGGPAVFKRV